MRFQGQFTPIAILTRMAVLTSLGFAVASLLIMIPALTHYYPRRLQLVKQLAIFHLPLLGAIFSIWLAGHVARMVLGTTPKTAADALLRLAFFLILYAPVLWWGDRQTGVLRRFKNLGRRKPGANQAEGANPAEEGAQLDDAGG